jgi:hypothetical protein
MLFADDLFLLATSDDLHWFSYYFNTTATKQHGNINRKDKYSSLLMERTYTKQSMYR